MVNQNNNEAFRLLTHTNRQRKERGKIDSIIMWTSIKRNRLSEVSQFVSAFFIKFDHKTFLLFGELIFHQNPTLNYIGKS